MTNQIRRARAIVVVLCLFAGSGGSSAADDPRSRLNVDCDINISQQDSSVHVTWPIGEGRRARVVFDLNDERPLIGSIAVSSTGAEFVPVAAGLDPVLFVRVGDRDLDKRGGWTIFFDRMQRKPGELHPAVIKAAQPTAVSRSRRATLTIANVSAGPFRGELRWTFFADNPFVMQEAVVSTQRKRTAFLYDMGLACRKTRPVRMSWHEADGPLRSQPVASFKQARNLAVKGRAIAAEFDRGSIVLFPPPHRYFYPLDFSDNLSNIWTGPRYHDRELPFGFGIRHDPRGDNRFVPWFNAPPGTQQELGLFLLVSADSSEDALTKAARLTRHDRFERLPGHVTFSSHYHVEHTRELLGAQNEPRVNAAETGRLPSGCEYTIPARLVNPGFARVFREMGIDIVHLAEFHFGQTPRMNQQQRLSHLELLHAECDRLSDERFLLLPGEEPNVHLGGHWISFFPKPVYWVLNRTAGTPFVVEHENLGSVYHVGGEADVLRLLRAEGGLAWTAHPRIKGSTGFPDLYRDRLFFQSDRFLGAAWKAMPADLSDPRIGSRVLNLLDDMSNWGDPKFVPGEVDVFKIEPDHELYGHMNVNYLRLDHIPRFDDGWQPILTALRRGQFFVTTGEVLIPKFTVNGTPSGEVATLPDTDNAEVVVDLKWTFPLSFAEIITGDGSTVKRRRIDLSDTGSFGRKTFKLDADLAGQRWVRVEAWDVATNGAFTQPVWLR